MGFVAFPERLAELAAADPDLRLISFESFEVTAGELHRRAVAAADALHTHWNIRRGERIAWLGTNDPAMIVLLAAAMRIGAILVPLNHRLAAAELRATLDDAGASLLVVDRAFVDVARDLHVPLADRDAIWNAIVSNRSDLPTFEPDVAALIVYTSGTTGRPKGAVHTNAMLHANVIASAAFHRFESSDSVLTVLPMFHVGGLCIQTLPALCSGVRVIVHPRFEPGAWLDAVERERPTLSLLVPATMRAIQDHPRWSSSDLSSLRMIGAGSSTIPTTLIGRFHQRRIPVCQVYGATETGPVSIVLDPGDAYANVGAAGKPAHGVTIRLDARGREAAEDEVGEVLVSGPNVVEGYWNDAHNAAFEGRWFRSGDLATRDANGVYTIVGRAKDMIVSGGENIYPAEIETVLIAVDGVDDVAVVGVPDRQWGETPVAVVVARGDALLDQMSLRSAIGAALELRIARFKHPKRIVFRATLPRNALGKVQKQTLVDELSSS